MILGLGIGAFTFLHVMFSLIGIAAGLITVLGMIRSMRLPAVTALFLSTTLLTSVTGFLFPFHGVTPGIVLGILSVIVLVLAIVALHGGKLAGPWRGTYVVSATAALYFNFFVLIVQSFAKSPALNSIAPTQSSPVFIATQLAALIGFIVLGTLAFRHFRPAGMRVPAHAAR